MLIVVLFAVNGICWFSEVIGLLKPKKIYISIRILIKGYCCIVTA